MASHKASSIGSPETLNNTSACATPQVRSESFHAEEEYVAAAGSDTAEQDPDLLAAQTNSPLDVATPSASGQKDSPAFDTSTSTATYSPKAGSADSATSCS